MSSQNSDAVFPDGIRVYKPRESAPSFVKADVVINPEELSGWLASVVPGSNDGTIRLQIKESGSTGNYYISINDFKPQPQGERVEHSQEAKARMAEPSIEDVDMPDLDF